MRACASTALHTGVPEAVLGIAGRAPARVRTGLTALVRIAARFAAAAGTAAIAAAAASPSASAAPPPTSSLAIVVPFAAGGPTDTVARTLGAAITARTGVPVDVRNRPGAGGTVGAALVARSPADGSVLLLHHVGMATAPALYRSLPFDPLRDFEPIGRIVDVPMTLVARPDLPFTDLPDALRAIRRDAGSIVVAYAGLGAASHLCGLLLSIALDVDLIQVPYRGTGPALADLQRGQADLMCDQTTNTTGAIRAGRVRAIAVLGRQRLAALPQVPAITESGLRGPDLTIWHGLYAPRGVPRERIDVLAALLRAGLQDPAFLRAMQDANVVVAAAAQARPAALRAHLAAEIARWTPLIRRSGQHAD